MISDEMFVILLRHGIAHPSGSMPEEKRGLTKTGHRRMKEIARSLARLVPKVDEIYASPLLRCRETAAWVGDRYKLEISIADELRPAAEPLELRKLIDRSKARAIICVGHEPTLTAMMLEITGMQADRGLELKKGGCYGVRVAAERASLEWMVPPRILRRM